MSAGNGLGLRVCGSLLLVACGSNGGGTGTGGTETESTANGDASAGSDESGTDGPSGSGTDSDDDGTDSDAADCGDGQIGGSEACDRGDDNGAAGSPCRADCTAATVSFVAQTVALDNAIVWGLGPSSLTADDLDGDGWLDVAVTDRISGDIATVIGTQRGTLATTRAVPGTAPHRGLVVGDFGGDPRVDVVALVGATTTDDLDIDIYIATDTGLELHDTTFFPGFPEFVTGTFPLPIAAGDLVGDERDDVVVTDRAETTYILEGIDGGFGEVTELAAIGGAGELVVHDLDGDGDDDILAGWGLGCQAFLANNGSFVAGPALPDDVFINELHVADVTDDGLVDVVGGHSDNFNVWAGPLDALDVVQTSIGIPGANYLRGIGSGDFDGNGTTDIAVVHYLGLTTFERSGAAWSAGVTYDVPLPFASSHGEPLSVDPDGDGRFDILLPGGHPLAGTSSIGVIRRFAGSASGLQPAVETLLWTGFAGELSTGGVALGDVSGDGHPELITAVNNMGFTEPALITQALRPDGSLGVAQALPTVGEPGPAVSGDFNGDGRVDLAYVALGSMAIRTGLQSEEFGFDNFYGPTPVFPEPDVPGLIFGDDEPQLGPIAVRGTSFATAERQTGQVYVAPDVASADVVTDFGATPLPSAIAWADVAGGSEPDLLVLSESESALHVFAADGQGFSAESVTEIQSGHQGLGPADLAVGDLDGDGRPDVVTANADSEDIAVLLATNNGFTAPTFIEPTPEPGGTIAVALGDIDGDGHLDLVSANRFRDSVSLLLGRGDGTFAAAREIGTGAAPTDIIVADIDGDGRDDLITADFGDNTLTVLLSGAAGEAWEPNTANVTRDGVPPVTFVHDCFRRPTFLSPNGRL